jgi:hypothetical protein
MSLDHDPTTFKRLQLALNECHAGDPALEEFIRVMQPRNKAAIWANDDAIPEAAKMGDAPRKKRKLADPGAAAGGSDGEGEGDDDDEEFQDLSEVKQGVSAGGLKKRKTAAVEGGEEGGRGRSHFLLVFSTHKSRRKTRWAYFMVTQGCFRSILRSISLRYYACTGHE